MKILGQFVVVLGCVVVNKLLGFSNEAMLVGTIVGAGSYIFLNV